MSHHKGGHHLHKHHRDTHHGHQKISKFPLYCEKNLWSQTFAAWKKYDVKRARLPKVNEERLVDMHSNIPHDLTQFIGTHNEDCMKTFTTIRETFEDAKSFPHLLTLVGPSGSGKSSMMYAFMIELASFIHLNTVEKRKKLYLWMDGKKHLSDFQKLWSAITRYLGSDIDRQVKVNYRFIILDNADFIPPSYQQSLKRIIEEFSNSSKFILIVNDSNKIISSIQSKAVSVRTRAVGERDCLLIILNILHRNHIGHDREAIKEIFHHFKPHYSISNMLDFIQELFQKYEYVSLANVLKKLGKVVKPHVSAVEVLQPLQRCDICTLVPPCKHYDSEILVGNAIERRSKNGLPRYKGGMVCPDWARFGHCTFYNNNGHCSLDHPRNIHVVDDPLIRCPSCTIPWPCNHCSFSPARVRLHKLISDIRGRLSRIKQLVAPDPPYSLTKHIDVLFPTFRADLQRINRIYVTPSKLAILDDAQNWLETSVCVVLAEYVTHEEAVKLAFGELYRTPMLHDYNDISKPKDDDSIDSLSLASSAGDVIELEEGSEVEEGNTGETDHENT